MDETDYYQYEEEDIMISDTVQGALYLSAIDMVLLVVFLYVLGLLFKLFPLVNKIKSPFKKKGE